MKPKLKQNEYNLFSTKPKAIQGRTSLQRIRDDLRRRSVRIVLSPVSHYSPFKSPRTSITNLSPRRSVLLRRSLSQEGSTSANQLIEKLLTPRNKKKRKCTKRLNEAEKLQEELLSKKYITDGNIFASKRVLRSRLILTPKSPLVRVKKTNRQSASSRKISFNSLNKYLSRDVRIELEKLPREEEPLSGVSQIEDSEPARDNQIFRVCGQNVQPIEITINLEKLSPSITRRYLPEETDQVPSTSSVQSEAFLGFPTPSVQSEEAFLGFPTNDRQTSEVPRKLKHGPILDIRIELEKLPDTDSVPETETHSVESSENHVEIPQIEDVTESISIQSVEKEAENIVTENISIQSVEKVSENVVTENISIENLGKTENVVIENISIENLEKETENVDDTFKDDQSIEEAHKQPSTPTRETVPEQIPVSVTPAVTSEPMSTPINTPEPGTVENTELSGKKTPKSLDIPLRRITIVKSKFKKMNKVLESPNKVSPIKVRPNTTYLASPLAKPKALKQRKPSIPDTTTSNLDSTADNVSLSNSTVENMISDDSRSSTSSSLSSVSPPTPEGGISCQTKSTTERVPIKPVYIRKTLLTSSNWTYGMGKLITVPSNKANVEVGKEMPKSTATSVETKSTQSVKTPPSVPSVPVCTEVSSPLSRGQLLTAKSLARSPHAPQMVLGKSPSHLARSSKPDSGKKTYPKSPLHRGRLLTEQSLAASPKHQNSGIVDKTSRSASAGSSVHRSNSNVSSSSKDVSYRQKWSSAGDLLKSSSMDTESDSSGNTSPVATPLDPTSDTGIFSNSKTCAAVLSTLKPVDRDKSKSEPKLPQWSASDVAKPLAPKKTPDSGKIRIQDRKSASRSQPDLSQNLAGVKIDSTKSYAPDSQSSYLSTQKKPFHIPKVKPGISNFYTTFSAPSNLPRSGFTPSPPTKSSINRPVLDKMYASTSQATASYRQPPPKSSQSSYKPWPKPTTSSFKAPTTKPFYSSSSHSSTINTIHTSITQTSSTLPHSLGSTSTVTKTSQISRSQPLTKPPSTSILSPFKPPYPVTSQPSYTKSPYTGGSHSTTKPSTNSQFQFVKPAPLSFTPPPQPPYVPPKPSTHTSQTSSSIQTPTKPLPVKPLPSSKSPKSKSKSRPFKTAYMSSRSSNTPSYSKCLPSGPQYSPTYSKYLQNGFSRLPTAQYKAPKPARPVSPGTKDILRFSTEKTWMSNTPAPPPIGPSGSLMSSTVTSDPSYSPLCPNYEI